MTIGRAKDKQSTIHSTENSYNTVMPCVGTAHNMSKRLFLSPQIWNKPVLLGIPKYTFFWFNAVFVVEYRRIWTRLLLWRLKWQTMELKPINWSIMLSFVDVRFSTNKTEPSQFLMNWLNSKISLKELNLKMSTSILRSCKCGYW